ncbi:hypothetical protein LS48_14165 [Aequorivita aquimaris]|uniref:Uncharacterized protein n=1 Tax=Aequorivita aquimaris TaxID=1548749 RepID=A0A137REL8_9FLAO|nr:hypothetical protein [Aequorivita aquimaris]KXN97933.1 hypothetical protein LS48_14165 [Aequorivita aquimaris]
MIKKIPRDISIIKYRNFPLWEVDDETQTEFSHFPKVYSYYCVKLTDEDDERIVQNLTSELSKLFGLLEVNQLIFLSAHNMRWIAKHIAQENDYETLINAVSYFDKHKLTGKFNGAIEVDKVDLEEFFKHFVILTNCDSGFFHNHFLNKKQDILGYVHYSGEVQFYTLNQDMNERFLKKIKETDFVDAMREDTNRI